MSNRLNLLGKAVLIGAAFLTFRGFAVSDPASPLLSPAQVMDKAVERAESAKSRQFRPDYFYNKHTVTEDLDLKGKVKDRKEKLYEVKVESGLSYLRLLQLNGQTLSGAELKKQEEKELAERQKITDAKTDKKGDERENFLTAELVQKYNFTLVEHTVFKGRETYVLNFEPKSDLPAKKLTDRFLNQMAGTAWIDAQDFEIARAEIHLKSEVTLWGGVVGTLKHCRFTMERTRMPDGVWFNSMSHGIFEGRKLLEPMLIRTRSESSNFHHPGLALR